MAMFHDRSEWERGFVGYISKMGLIWHTDGSKKNEGTRTGLWGHGIRQRFNFRAVHDSISGRSVCY
jgi:hypothetical protein